MRRRVLDALEAGEVHGGLHREGEPADALDLDLHVEGQPARSSPDGRRDALALQQRRMQTPPEVA